MQRFLQVKNSEVSYGRGRRTASRLRNPGLLLILLTMAACATLSGKSARDHAVAPWDTPHGWGLDGYDPVAYFTDGKPVLGDPQYTYAEAGVKWKFASLEHQQIFAADPARYEPQFGGYCAYGVSLDVTVHGDPKQWAIVDDKLYVNANIIAMRLWSLDRSGNIVKADKNWPLILNGPPEAAAQ